MNSFGQRLVVGAISMMALVMAACGSTTTAIAPSPTPTVAVVSPSPSPSPTASALTFPVTGQGANAGIINGTVTIIPGDSSFTVVVDLAGMAPNTTHPSHIHTGSSCDANGPVEIALQPVVVDASGHGAATSTIPQAYVVPATGWYVNVHQGPDLVGANATPIACTVLK